MHVKRRSKDLAPKNMTGGINRAFTKTQKPKAPQPRVFAAITGTCPLCGQQYRGSLTDHMKANC